jgi:hypothetical protein
MADYDLFKVKNTSQEPLKYGVGYKKWIEWEPGEIKIIPLETLDVLLGRPDLMGKERAAKFARLCRNYGIFEDYHLWSTVKPPLEVRDLEDQPVLTIADDPEGNAIEQAGQTKSEKNELEHNISVLQRQVKALQAQLETEVRAEQAGNLDDIETDDPKRVAVGPRRGREVD